MSSASKHLPRVETLTRQAARRTFPCLRRSYAATYGGSSCRYAFDQYFTKKRYLDSVTQKFGWETRKHIDKMTRHKLRRKIVEDMEMSDAQPAA